MARTRTHLPLAVLVAVLAVCVALAAPGRAFADVSTLSSDAPPPSSDQVTHATPFELLASQAASALVGRPVHVRCDDDPAWSLLAGSYGFDPAQVAGLVESRFGSDGVITYPREGTDLAPSVCTALQAFAEAAQKPTSCRHDVTVTTTVTVRRPVAMTVRRRIRLHGRLVWQVRAVRRLKTVSQLRDVPSLSPRRPCFDGQSSWNSNDAAYWRAYRESAFALLVLAHESAHLSGAVGGTLPDGAEVGDRHAEATANCYGIQHVARLAQLFGDDPADAQSVAAYVWLDLYPGYQGTDYWTSDCREDGPLDLTPGDGSWPS
jgi:hypothetical protein